MSLIPNRGQHTAWDPKGHPLTADIRKGSTYLINTAWLRAVPVTEGANVLFHPSPSLFSVPDPASARYTSELDVLKETDVQYLGMLQSIVCDSSTPLCSSSDEATSVCEALSEAFKTCIAKSLIPRAYGSVRARKASASNSASYSIGDVKGLAAHISLTIRGVSEWIRSLSASGPTVTVEQWETSAGGVLAALRKEGVLPECFAALDAKEAFVELYSEIAGGEETRFGSHSEALLGAGLFVGTVYFSQLFKLFPVFFVRWCAAVSEHMVASSQPSKPDEVHRFVIPKAARTLLCITQRGVLCQPLINSASLSVAAAGGVALGCLIDGGSLQATGASDPSPNEEEKGVLSASREAFVASISRAALEAFVEFVFVAGPLQWATSRCGGLVESHPLMTGRRSEFNEPTQQSKGGRRIESSEGSKPLQQTVSLHVSPLTSTNAWDVVVRDIFPIFLSQGGYEFPWHGVESMLRSAVAPSVACETVSKSWGPTASLRVDRKKAMTIVDDAMIIVAKEVSEVGFPSRIAGLTSSVPNGVTRLCLRTICSALERYRSQGSSVSKAHADLFSSVALRQKQRSTSRVGGSAPQSLSISSLQAKSIEDMDTLIRDKVISLESVTHSLISTPTAYSTPILFTILSLMGASTPLVLPTPPRGAQHGGRGAAGVHLLPSSGIYPTIVDIAELLELVQIKIDLMPSIIELKAAVTTASNAYVSPQLVSTVRARVLVNVLLMAVARLSQLRHADQIEHLLFSRKLLDAVKNASVDAVSRSVSSSAVDEVLSTLRTPIPNLGFNFSKFLVEGSEGATRWLSNAIDPCQGYTPLSSLMEGLFGGEDGKPSVQTSEAANPLISSLALTLEAFADKILFRIANAEFADVFKDKASVSRGEEAGASLRPLSTPSVDFIAWCLLYSKAIGLGFGTTCSDATGFLGRFPFGVQGAMKGATNASTISGHYVAISPYLNPLVVDHPTRGYVLRKTLWGVGELFARALLAVVDEKTASTAIVKYIALEARKFSSSLQAFGILEWSCFGAAWASRFVPLFQSYY